jgi:peptide/nickel transport system substrate-binding protein
MNLTHPHRRVLAALTAGAVALPLVLTACTSSSSSQGSQTPGPTTLVTTTPAASSDVAAVTWALPTGEPRSLDPTQSGDYPGNTVVTNLCESLLRLHPDFSTTPGLATAIVRTNPVTTVITVRSGVTFWDGTPMTAADVAYSLNRNLDPRVASVSASIYRNVKSITVTGANQVTIAFKTPDSSFIPSMAGVAGAVVEKAFAQRTAAKFGTPGTGVMCTGPFSLEDWEPGAKIVLKRYDGYWDTAHKAGAGTFTFVVFNDDSALTSALRSGEVDGSYLVPTSSLAALGSSGEGTLYYGPSTESYSLGPAAATGPVADPRIRQALSLVIDRKAIIEAVLKGTGQPLKSFTPPFVWQGDPAKAIYDAGYAALPDNTTPDVTKAKALVQAAKPSRTSLVLAVPSGAQALLQIATLVQSAVQQIGLSITIKQMQPSEFSGLFYDPSLRQGIDLIATTGYIEVPSALYYPPAFVFPGAPFNWTNYQDPSVTANMSAAIASSDPQVSAEKFVAAQAVYAPANLQITLAEAYNRLFMKKGITGAPASFSYISSPWAAEVGGSGS